MDYLKLGDLKITDPSIVKSFSEQVGYQYASHDIATGKPILQAVGPTLSKIDMTLQLNVSAGHDVVGTIAQIDKIRDSGLPQLLVFADGVYRGYYVLTDVNTTIITTASNGRITNAELSITLQEYAERKVVSISRCSEKKNDNKNNRKIIER